MRNLSFVLILSSLVSVAAAAPILYAGNGHYYDFIQGTPSWTDASAAANASTFMGANGYLATLTDAAENAWLASTFGMDGWIGLSQPDGSGEPADGFAWVTGETFAYSNWESGEPNDLGGEDYVHMYAGGTWNDLPDDAIYTRQGYYVEYEAVPEPMSMAVLALGLVAVVRKRRK